MKQWVWAAVVLGAVAPASAQDVGGIRADITLGAGVALDRDPSLSGARSSVGNGVAFLRFDLSSKTRTQGLKFNWNGSWMDHAGPQTNASLSYTRKGKSSTLTFGAGYKTLPAGTFDFDTPFKAETRGFDLRPQNAKTRISVGSLRFRAGLGHPIGLDTSYRVKRRRTSGSSGGRTTRQALDSAVSLRFAARTEGVVFWNVEQLEASGSTSLSQTQRVAGISIEHSVSRTSALKLALGHRTVKTTQNSVYRENSGLEWQVELDRIRKRGLIFVRAKSERVGQGGLKRLQFGLKQERHDQSLELVIGAGWLAQNATTPTITLRYRAAYVAGKIWVIAARDFAASDETGETRIASKLGLGMTRDIGQLGSLELNLGVLRASATGLTPEREARRLRASYHHKLRRDWGVVVGAQRRVRSDTSLGRLASNSVFLTFEHKFSGGL